MADIDIEKCIATFQIEPHYECPDRLFSVSGSAQHPTHGKVATLSGYVMIKRAAWKAAGEFGSIMEAETQELYDFSLAIFNNDIIVHPWLLNGGGPRSGSGCWGKELNKGNIVYLQDLTVKEPFTRRGVGSWFLEQFLHSPRVNVAASHVFCWPFPNEGSRVKPNLKSITDIAYFFQKNHFRRIGRTVFFCYSVNPAHPSRTLAIANDATAFNSDFTHIEQGIEKLEAQYPLIYAIDTNKTAGIRDVIAMAYALDHSIIHRKGPDGYSPVHLATKKRNVHALRKLLDLGVTEDLNDTANIEGATPLQIIAEIMRRYRHYEQDVLGMWERYREEDVACLNLLLKSATPATS